MRLDPETKAYLLAAIATEERRLAFLLRQPNASPYIVSQTRQRIEQLRAELQGDGVHARRQHPF